MITSYKELKVWQKADQLAFRVFDPFGGAKPRLWRRGKEAPLRVNPEQAPAFRPGSRRVDLNETFPRTYQYDITSQLRRAALSIPTNIAEGCASFHSSEFLQFFNVSRRSLSETHYLLNFACRRNLIKQNQLLELELICEEISKILNSLIKSIRQKKNRQRLNN